MPEALLQVRDLTVKLRPERGARAILDRISFDLEAGRITGLVGESGCGKTTLALALLNLLPRETYLVRGSVRLLGEELTGLEERRLRKVRGAALSMIFQDPALALNPVLRVRDQLVEVARAHGVRCDPATLLESAGLAPSPRILRAYPHQLSGGERQRVTIAQALACRPALAIADEPFTALDAPRVVELAALFTSLRDTAVTSFLVISHSPGVLARIADTMLVLDAGRLVEQGPPRQVFGAPTHPYTARLAAAAEGLPSGA
jgi:ABC-type glutathione transport system ATPase component